MVRLRPAGIFVARQKPGPRIEQLVDRSAIVDERREKMNRRFFKAL